MNEEILKRLDALAAKLGTTGEQVWAILIQQAKVEAAFSLGWALLSFAFCVGFVKLAFWLARDEAGNSDSDASFVAFLGAVFALVIGLCNLYGARWYFMPEAWALQQILGTIR